jgi:hypothetical protein
MSAATLDLATGEQTGETFEEKNWTDRYSRRPRLFGTLSYLPEHTFLGTHEFKIGAVVRLSNSRLNQWTHPEGDCQLVFDSGAPTQIKTLNTTLSSLIRRSAKVPTSLRPGGRILGKRVEKDNSDD